MEKNEKVTPEVIEVITEDKYKDVEVISDTIFKGKKYVTVKDLAYMCNYISTYEGCENCILNDGRSCGFIRIVKHFGSPRMFNLSVLKWLEENPPTSYLMDIKVKMPNIKLDSDYNIPVMCVKSLYGDENFKCELCDENKFDSSREECRVCWRQPMEKIDC